MMSSASPSTVTAETEINPDNENHSTAKLTSTSKKLDNNNGSCPCSNISIMQLFHELKAKFPAVPDHIVSQCINKYYHDRDTCISLLNNEQLRLPRGLPYPPDLMGVQHQQQCCTSSTKTPSCTVCGMLNSQKVNPTKTDNKCANIDKLLVETKEKLNKVPHVECSDKKFVYDTTGDSECVRKMKNTTFYVSNDDSEIDDISELANNNNKCVKNENMMGTGKKFVRKSINKVGRLAGKLSKKCDLKKYNSSSNDASDEPTVPEIRKQSKSSTYEERFSAHDLSINAESGVVNFSKRKDLDSGFVDETSLVDQDEDLDEEEEFECEEHLNLTSDTKTKSQSMECLLSSTLQLKDKTASLQDLNQDNADLKPIGESTPKSLFNLSKSTRLTDFNIKKPPLPSKPFPSSDKPKKPERRQKLPLPVRKTPLAGEPTNVKDIGQNETEKCLDQKPPLPKRPSTLPVLTHHTPVHQTPPTTDPTEEYSPQNNPPPLVSPSQRGSSSFNSPTSVNVSLNVNVDVIPSPQQNSQRTILNVNPELSWLSPGSPVQSPGQEQNSKQSPRSFTTVNLTLRPPASEPQPPIDIHSANNSLTYSSSSYDPRKGFQSSVQITVGPAGGTVSAVRVRPRSSYIPEENQQTPVLLSPRAGSLPDLPGTISIPNYLIKRQLERKEKLRLELMSEKRKLSLMQKEVTALKTLPKEVNASINIAEELRLRREIQYLQAECVRLADEVDRKSYSRAPLGETSEEFYQNIYTGQRIEPSNLMSHRTATTTIEQTEGPPWTCYKCTFSNHPLLNFCEECGMIRPIRQGMFSSNAASFDPRLAQNKLNLLPPPPGATYTFSEQANNTSIV